MMLSDVCLSVAYIGPKSRTERPRKTKIGTDIAHVTRDSDTANITYLGHVPLMLWKYSTPESAYEMYREVVIVKLKISVITCELLFALSDLLIYLITWGVFNNSISFQQPTIIGINLSISCHTYTVYCTMYCVPQST